MKTAAVILLLCLTAGAIEPIQSHKWSRTHKAITVARIAFAGADLGRTCSNLANGAHERFLPTQSCAGVGAFILSGVAVEMLIDWQLTRRGHDKLGMTVEAIGAASNAVGFAYSSTH